LFTTGEEIGTVAATTAPALERGDFAPPTADPAAALAAAGARLVVATYNIRYAVGSRLISGGVMRKLGVARPGRRPRLVARNIGMAARVFAGGGRMPPVDLLALQEADRGTRRAGGHDIARELAEALGMNYARAASPTPRDVLPKDRQWWLDFEEPIGLGEEGDMGVALLSRRTLADAARVELPWADCPWRPRLAMAATVALGGQSLRVFNAHIDPHAGVEEQLRQHEAVLASASAAGGGPVLLLGDFNTLSKKSAAVVREFLEARGYETPLPTGEGTWRSGPLRLHADWIFGRGLRFVRWGVARGVSVSDHWPVWAEIESAR
jgi:endonuclease/exonuclease/phosphatase family metal-dependent hydrolase